MTGVPGGRVAFVLLSALSVVPPQGPERSPMRVPGMSSSLPHGWMLSTIADGKCQYMVPANWHIDASGQTAMSLDGSFRLTVGSVASRDWDDHRLTVAAAIHPTAVHEQSDHRLWYEFSESPGESSHYVSVTDGRFICDAQFDVKAGDTSASELTTRIANGIQVAPPPR